MTNRDLLVRVPAAPGIRRRGRLDTGFYDRNLAELTDPGRRRRAAARAASRRWPPRPTAAHGRRPASAAGATSPPQPQVKSLRGREPDGTRDGAACRIRYRLDRDGLRGRGLPRRPAAGRRPGPGRSRSRRTATGVHRRALRRPGLRRLPARRPRLHRTAPLPRPRRPYGTGLAARAHARHGRPRRAGLAEGDRVEAGQPLLWLEAMKMEHRITAPAAGTLTALPADAGQQVEVGALLAVVTARNPRTHDAPGPS